MGELTRRESAFVRPSPTSGTLGGVARRTREAMLLCEAAGFDVVLVETVGVGQSEVTVAGMVDVFVLVLAPGAGDELQGIKRGVIELADLVVVNKADGDLEAEAKNVAAAYQSALRLVRARTVEWEPRVLLVSALENRGIEALWQVVDEFRTTLASAGGFDHRRAAQAQEWMWSEVSDTLLESVRHDEATAALAADLELSVASGTLSPTAAARRLLDALGAPLHP
jgi:LAO/AO transport system kinase